ncbi:TetR/AcrR family transcriptional regulator [Paenibacillus filicis]|uniref:TetR/AcrR family transcriptional regulator n=1 Tax=Paenibacillus filicis TaxID=669464 RepID=A0ABU9DLC7_9BACL
MARSKEFNEDVVLLKAMRLFWEQGYEKTSMTELVSHMGIHKGSIYDTFGDKQSLYTQALRRYSEMLEQLARHRLNDAQSSKDAIRLLFEMAIQRVDDNPEGCFMVNTAVEVAKMDPEAKKWVHLNWARTEHVIRELIVQGQLSGEFSKTLDAESLSYFFNNALVGLRVMVKTISDKEKLNQIMETTLAVLE